MNYYRICYKGGIAKKENELFEFHKICDCILCVNRYKFTGQPRNCLTVTTDSKEKFEEVDKIIKNWKCKNGNEWLKTEYITI